MKRRLRIGIDAHVITGRYQGTRTTLTRLLQALAWRTRPHDIIVYSDDPKQAQALVGGSGLEHRALGSGGSVKRLLRVFPRLLKQDHIDVAVFQYNSPLFSRSKRVVFIHDILPITHRLYFPRLNQLRVWLFFTISVMRSHLVITVSHYTRKAVLDYYKIPDAKVCTVLNGPSFDPSIYIEPRTIAAQPTILAVGRIESRKNIPLLVKAFQASKVDAVLIIVGSFDLGFEYDLPDDPTIIHYTNVADAKLIELYRSASLFVYPSAAEGFGLPLLDALLFGVPTISSNKTAMEEIGQGAAELFDPTQPDALYWLAARIRSHFLNQPVPCPSVAQRRELAARYNWNKAASDLIAAIENINANV